MVYGRSKTSQLIECVKIDIINKLLLIALLFIDLWPFKFSAYFIQKYAFIVYIARLQTCICGPRQGLLVSPTNGQ